MSNTKAEASISLLAPNVEYFELESERVGARLGVWVVLPLTYSADSKPHAVLYAVDGNSMWPQTTRAALTLLGDPQRPVDPVVQVSIGYTGTEAGKAIAVRNRDLVPPGEPFPLEIEEYVGGIQKLGMINAALYDEFMARLRKSRADNFLGFIEDELHPEIVKRYRVRSDSAGLFGSSYGGLFTLYAFTAGSKLFNKFGASSPGILSDDSQVYALYRDLLTKANRAQQDVHLHMTVNDTELTGPVQLYRTLGIGSLKFLDMVRESPLSGLQLSSAIIRGENHGSGVIDAYRSFIRTCYELPNADVPFNASSALLFRQPA